MHHRMKKDAPSGTALMLAESILGPRNLSYDDLRHGREGVPGERGEREVGMHYSEVAMSWAITLRSSRI